VSLEQKNARHWSQQSPAPATQPSSQGAAVKQQKYPLPRWLPEQEQEQDPEGTHTENGPLAARQGFVRRPSKGAARWARARESGCGPLTDEDRKLPCPKCAVDRKKPWGHLGRHTSGTGEKNGHRLNALLPPGHIPRPTGRGKKGSVWDTETGRWEAIPGKRQAVSNKRGGAEKRQRTAEWEGPEGAAAPAKHPPRPKPRPRGGQSEEEQAQLDELSQRVFDLTGEHPSLDGRPHINAVNWMKEKIAAAENDLD
jgi:hypothetical protein